jgi:hypothetical protein
MISSFFQISANAISKDVEGFFSLKMGIILTIIDFNQAAMIDLFPIQKPLWG